MYVNSQGNTFPSRNRCDHLSDILRPAQHHSGNFNGITPVIVGVVSFGRKAECHLVACRQQYKPVKISAGVFSCSWIKGGNRIAIHTLTASHVNEYWRDIEMMPNAGLVSASRNAAKFGMANAM